MKRCVLNWIVCPVDGHAFELAEAVEVELGDGEERDVVSGRLICDNAHAFPIELGVPRLRLDDQIDASSQIDSEAAADSRKIAASFGREWQHFDHDSSRTWHETLDDRQLLFVREVALDRPDLSDRLVLDAGCGNGTHSWGISGLGCDVLGADVTDAVVEAHQRYAARPGSRVHYIQADLMNPPFRPQRFDVMYSSGVLHHNPDTREALESVLRSLAPGGTCYIWVYHPEPGVKFKLQLMLRSIVCRWPAPLKHAFVYIWSVQSMIRQHLRTLLRLNDERDRLTWRERMIDLMDIYTPRYRWMHTQDEVRGWYRELGLTDIAVTEVRDWGFGTVGRLPRAGVSPEEVPG
jgi:SAM-dependent methyltransferase